MRQAMDFSKKIFVLLLILGFQSILCYDQCKDVCKNAKLPAKIPDKYQGVRVVCHRGCRFFNIIKYQFKTFSVKKTKEKCNNACQGAYKFSEESAVCKKGCELMARKRMRDLSIFFEYPQEEDSVNNALVEPDIQALESNILSNPFVKQELEEGINFDDYKIPEKHIRTMPILIPEPDKILKVTDTEDWLTCASKNSGIPKWILFAVMLTAILVAICLSLSMETQNRTQDIVLIDQVLIDINHKKNLLEDNHCLTDQEKQFLAYYLKENDVGFANRTPPPKYCELSYFNNT